MPGGQAHNRIEATTATTNSSVIVGSISTQVLPEDKSRLHVIITNDSDEWMYLAAGEEAVLNKGIPLSPGGTHNIDYSALFMHEINAICASGGKNLCIFKV